MRTSQVRPMLGRQFTVSYRRAWWDPRRFYAMRGSFSECKHTADFLREAGEVAVKVRKG